VVWPQLPRDAECMISCIRHHEEASRQAQSGSLALFLAYQDWRHEGVYQEKVEVGDGTVGRLWLRYHHCARGQDSSQQEGPQRVLRLSTATFVKSA
jgi:hypothetical protein